MEGSRYVFIFGAPRSGTTLLYGMLVKGQSKVGGIHMESQFYSGSTNKEYKIENYIKNPYLVKLLTGTEIEIIFECSRSPGEFFKNAIDYYIKKYQKQFFVEKSPAHTFYFKQIKKDFPDPIILVTKRDPCAVINSMVRTSYVTLVSDRITKRIGHIKALSYASAWLKYYNYDKELSSIRKYTKCFVFKYEDIVQKKMDIRNEMEKILGEKLEELFLAKPNSSDVYHRRNEFDTSRINAYKRDMDSWAIHVTRFLFTPSNILQKATSRIVILLVLFPARVVKKIITDFRGKVFI